MADRPQSQSQQRSQTTGHRDMMFCHECQDEWYRDEHGLTCPECGSDFTEIIEDDNDPRDHHALGHSDDSDMESDIMPGLEEIPHHDDQHHQPWRDNDDPEEGDISNLQWRQVGPGRFAVTGTMYRTVSPTDFNRGAGGIGAGPISGFASMLNSIITGGRPQQPNQNTNEDIQNPGARGSPNSGSGTTPGGHRFTYTAGARLYPRDADNPGPHVEPVDEMNNVLVGLMAAFGEPPGGPNQLHHHHHHQHPLHAGFDDDDDNHVPRGSPLNPLMALFSQMMAGNGQIGDAVYSQEALDRIISQLMEQNATSNAPGPATQSDIDSLPRKLVSEDMLGPEGKAECSICMDDVNIGEEVTELPCHHWFHHPCVSAWLSEHDTCPHCRKGITKQNDTAGNQSSQTGQSAPPNASPSGMPSMPGSFEATGHGVSDDPYRVPNSSAQDQGQNPEQQPGGAGNAPASGLFRSLFGPQR